MQTLRSLHTKQREREREEKLEEMEEKGKEDGKGKNVKEFICDQCDASAFTCRHLYRHILLHIGPSYQCQECKKSFKREDYLLKHLESICGSKSEKQTNCRDVKSFLGRRPI